jgi:prepilin-type processing-associated H-X9-DG protein/prepilin-type N-terminal cleavage/methylation domain-containing protein
MHRRGRGVNPGAARAAFRERFAFYLLRTVCVCARIPDVTARGFTLVELLVATAAAALLATLALPALRAAHASSLQSACAHNLRQIGAAIHLYANDHAGDLPRSTHEGDLEASWIFTLAPYLQHLDAVRLCPAEPRPIRDQRLANQGTSYVLNEYLASDDRDPFGNLRGTSYTNILRIPKPARTFAAFIVSESAGTNTYQDHTHSRNWRKGWKAVTADIEPDRHRSGSRNASRTGGSANYLFADGHVENIPAATLKRRVDSGENIALPPG